MKKQVNEPTHALSKCYVGKAWLRQCLGSQRFSLNKEGLGCEPKEGKKTFSQHKPSFLKSNGKYFTSCKEVEHLEKDCKSKKIISSIKIVILLFAYKESKWCECQVCTYTYHGCKEEKSPYVFLNP